MGFRVYPLAPRSKVPVAGSHGYKDATCDVEQVSDWLRGTPQANWAIATGTINGVFVVDVDPRNGGNESLATLEKQFGPLPATPTVETGGGGRHFYFAMPAGLTFGGTVLADGIDVKADGGGVVAAGSMHESGTMYVYAEGMGLDEIEVAQAPSWLIETLNSRRAPGSPRDVDGPIAEGMRNVALTSLAGTMRNRGMTAPEMTAALIAVNAARCQPPLPKSEVARIAESVARYAPGDPRTYPILNVGNRQLREMTAEAISILEATNEPPTLFQRGDQVVRILVDADGRPYVGRVGKDELRAAVAAAMNTIRITKEGEPRQVMPPDELLANILAQREAWLPELIGIAQQPFMRADGTVAAEPGYDAATRMMYIPAKDVTFTYVEDPSAADLDVAVNLLRDEFLGDFPFEDESSMANAIGSLATLVVRPAIAGRIPLFLIDKPQAGTGASLLAETFGWITSGRPPAMAPAPIREEEWAKVLLAIALQGPPCVVLDNIEHRLQSASLASALTSGWIFGRILGESTIATVPLRYVVIVTGNNIRLGGDMARRCVWIRLDAQRSRPWERREFRHVDLPGWVQQHRGELVGALLTIARAWHLAGRPAGVIRLGGFDEWATTIGGMLENAGIRGFLSNLSELYDRVDDEAPQWEAFLRALLVEFGTGIFKTSDVVKALGTSPTLPEALPDEISADDKSLSRRLGRAFAKRQGVRYGADEIRLTSGDSAGVKARSWRIECAVSGVDGVSERPPDGCEGGLPGGSGWAEDGPQADAGLPTSGS